MTKPVSHVGKTGPSRPSVATARSTRTTVAPVHRVAAHLARRFHQVCLGVLAEVTESQDLSPLQFAVLAALHAVAPAVPYSSVVPAIGAVNFAVLVFVHPYPHATKL